MASGVQRRARTPSAFELNGTSWRLPPAFVEHEFRDFLTCGVLAHGFARLRCTACALERLVPFSCKGRGFCPSCGGRRMTEGAARLVDGVLPRVPVRQWVLSLPYRLRYVLAWDHGLARAVLGVSVRVLLGFQRQRARRFGVRDGRSGSVTVIQRFGGGLNLNVHFHTLLLDGVFFEGQEGALEFRPLPPPTDDEVGGVLARIAARVQRQLRRRGLDPWEADGVQADPLVDESPALAGLSSTSVQGRIALGPRAGARVWRLGDDPDAPWVLSTMPRHAHLAGFDLHANVAVPATDRARLEQLCRYLLRTAVAQDRLRQLDDGRVVLTLQSPWADGRRRLLFEPLTLLEKLAALIPRPRINLVLYHGVLAPHSGWRARVVAYGTPPAVANPCSEASDTSKSAPRHWAWAALMRRAFDLDVSPVARARVQKDKEDAATMQYKTLGNTGLLVSILSLGTMTFSGKGFYRAIGAVDQAGADELVKAAIEGGINVFDTADAYSEGESERTLGQSFKNLNIARQDVVVATKVFTRMGPGRNDVGASRGHIMDAMDASLRRLGTDHIDLYQVHANDTVTPIEETLRALDTLVTQGKVRYIGVSNWPAWKIAKARGVSALEHLARVDTLQAYYSIAGRDLERELVPFLEAEKLGLLVWSPLAGGLLSGRFSRTNQRPEGSRRSEFDFPVVDKERTWNILDVMAPIAKAHDCSPARIALAWLLTRPVVTSVLIGAKRLSQLQDNLAAVDVELTDDEIEQLNEVSELPPEYPGWMTSFQNADRWGTAPRPFADLVHQS